MHLFPPSFLFCFIYLLSALELYAQGPTTGEKIYKELCVECHGAQGEGVAEKHADPLFGEKSLPALAKYIDRTMPEDAEEKLDAAGSAAVAAYLYDAFYSPTARAKLHPETRATMRLTNRQFQESVADLIGSLQGPKPRGPATGLHAEYFASDGMNKKARKALERVDRALDYDFHESEPVEGVGAEQFSISWDGSLLPVETGWHEFRVRTPNGARLYINSALKRGDGNHRDDSGRSMEATIDEWVSSGKEVREHTAKVFLLGGRSYPLRFDYFKFKDKTGSVKLEWKAPGGEWQVLAAPYLSPEPSHQVTTVTVNFPADDASAGYPRGTAISKEWSEAVAKAALEAGSSVVAHLNALAGTNEKAPDRLAKVQSMLAALASRAFRHPLTDELKSQYVDAPFAHDTALELAVKRSVVQILLSPRFLYPELGAADDYTRASRLALTLWDSLPDQPLIEAAQRHELQSPDQLRAQAQRMLADPRARAKLAGFFDHWLALDATDHLSKDPAAYPDYDALLVTDMRRSLQLFAERVLWSDASDYREMLLADYLLLNPRLAKYYGQPTPAVDDFLPMKFDPQQRAGIFTQPYVLTAFSYHKSTSPIHRGVFLTRNILGRFLKPPPMAVEFKDDKFDPSLTMREKVTELTSKASCMGCHGTINPLGFSLENYDATGRWRTEDNHKPVNAISDYLTSEGEKIALHGPRDLAEHAATSHEARRGFVRQLFQALVKQTPAAYGADTLERLETTFSTDQCHIQKLVLNIALTAATPP